MAKSLTGTKPIAGPDGDDGTEIGPFHGQVAGKTISQWTQDWYTWAWQSPSSVSPFVSGSTGDGSGGFDAGSMFFIGGYDTSKGPLDVTVPFGESILVPVLNFSDTFDPKWLENKLTSVVKTGVTSLFASVDGKPVENLQSGLVRTDFFSLGDVRPGSFVSDLGVPVGTDLGPTKGVGFWIVLQGLSKGDHTLDFGGHTAYDVNTRLGEYKLDFSTHTTDIIHVV